MRKILFLLFMTLLLGSCKVKEKIVEVPIPQIKTEIKYIDKVKYDSIYLKEVLQIRHSFFSVIMKIFPY